MNGWRDRAACRGMDTNLFFADTGESYPPEVIAVCESCPVRDDCYTDMCRSLDTVKNGYRAGTTPAVRRRTLVLRTCKRCDGEFTSRVHNAAYCSDDCKYLATRARQNAWAATHGVSA